MPGHELDLFRDRTIAPFRYIGLALFPYQIPYIKRDRCENIIHQSGCFILGPWNIVSISGH
jgi:hypothetical protein